jgi:pimeloyl-ACP methyl ester carboxylesterase
MRHDVIEPAIPRSARDGDDIVVLLHGLFATAGVLRPMRRVLARHRGLHTAAMTYPPGPSVPELAARLRDFVAAFPAGSRLHLVGHSMGGIVARFFAQEIGDARVAQTISMASPFAGVRRAALLFGAVRDIDPGSAVLRRLRLGAADASHIPHTSIIAGIDPLIGAPVSHALPGSEVVIMEGRGHNTLLFDEEVARVVERRVLGRRLPRGESSLA